ncbi:subtilase-type protease inhibitor [Nocardia brasiliensis]|uniref:subtilase-type protease inhibitor n=1 Tax=Nocardia brasiliensis TaxID=37326 RepID=UPI0004A6EEC9|nr:subtilase-type protease inhibitor [Nocardia brasiliensis]
MSCTIRIVVLLLTAAFPLVSPQTVAAAADDAPSVLALTLGRGVSIAAAERRAVTLTCAPSIGGTHPNAMDACRALTDADGNIRALAAFTVPPRCPQNFDPVYATIDGVWRGAPVSDHGVFSNMCVLQATTVAVFNF